VKELSGAELVGFIKERQLRQVRGLRQVYGVVPKLLILRDNDAAAISKYVELKKCYGEDILVEVEEKVLQVPYLQEEIERANGDSSIHGVIVQLPLQDTALEKLDDILSKIAPEKDVDGLNPHSILQVRYLQSDQNSRPLLAGTVPAKTEKTVELPMFVSATATAIDWLLTSYNIELLGKNIAIVGQGRLVGAPLLNLWRASGYKVIGFDINDAEKLPAELPNYDVIISATGQPGLLKPEMVKSGAVVVDAGTASEIGVIKGDASDELRARRDIIITPKVGGVGPLTVAVLFDHVIQAASQSVKG
jgi:methylenetetrahydrofolate dehydrogenase (NADP+)/methenyltetrahydrofolate cyclohydrolase